MKLAALQVTQEAVWKDTTLQDVRLKVTGLKTLAFRQRFDALMSRPDVARQVRLGGDKESKARDLAFLRAIVDTVVSDWERITEDDGTTPIAFNKETCLQLMQESVDFRDAVITAAGEVDNEKFLPEEDLSGNSPASSAGG